MLETKLGVLLTFLSMLLWRSHLEPSHTYIYIYIYIYIHLYIYMWIPKPQKPPEGTATFPGTLLQKPRVHPQPGVFVVPPSGSRKVWLLSMESKEVTKVLEATVPSMDDQFPMGNGPLIDMLIVI